MKLVAGVITHVPASLSAVLVALVLIAVPPSARASLVIDVQSVGANSPSSADAFDVTLTNIGPLSITLGSFSFGVSVTDPAITFTSATVATVVPYVFAGQSLFGPTISTSGPGQTLDASDIASASAATIAAGATVGLGHVFFSVAAGDTAGPKTVTLAIFPTTALSDDQDSNLPVSFFKNGTITIARTASVPGPSTILLMLTGITGLTFARRQRREHLRRPRCEVRS
jgi:hypothetical protein